MTGLTTDLGRVVGCLLIVGHKSSGQERACKSVFREHKTAGSRFWLRQVTPCLQDEKVKEDNTFCWSSNGEHKDGPRTEKKILFLET